MIDGLWSEATWCGVVAGSNVARWLPPLEGPHGCGLFASSEAQQAQLTFQTGLGLDSSVTWETDGNSILPYEIIGVP